MAAITAPPRHSIDEKEYQRRIWAWTMYDWANSAFATTILAAVLPVYFSQVAGSNLPSAAVATAYWGFGLSLSLVIVAILSPVLGTISDVMRGKKPFLAVFAGIGIVSTALLVFVGTGDWVLASILGILGRIGFNGSISFYDAMLAHVAREEDRDKVSARGYAVGYLGGGILLAINIVMIQLLPGTWGPRLSFLSVAIWWAVFSIPLFRWVPEPLTAVTRLTPGENVIRASFRRLAGTVRDIRQYRELFKFLVAFLIYNDGIGTIIGVAAIYGAELGFGSVELILALLLVQFVAIPYSLIFGRLPAQGDRRRPFFLAFVIFNMVALPFFGITLARVLPTDASGAPPARFASTATAAGEGLYSANDSRLHYSGNWIPVKILAEEVGKEVDSEYSQADGPDGKVDFTFNGQKVEVIYSLAPDGGIWTAQIDGQPVIDADTGQPVEVNTYSPTKRYEVSKEILAETPGEHVLTLLNTGKRDPQSQGYSLSLGAIQVLPGLRASNLVLIIGMILAVELACLALAFLLGKPLFTGLAQKLDTRNSILLALITYAIIAIWGFFLNSVVEFWFLAWLVAVVQGGSQALSRSLYAGMSPASKSGEFFGLFGVMEKFSAILGPLLFAAAGTLLGSSRPAVLGLIAFFIIGGLILTRVDVDEGKRVAQAEDAVIFREA